jgi:hypothetical protein
MDDFNVSSLHESKNEWGARLLTILTPLIIEGFKSIFDESLKLCSDNNEMDKYLMTFQNFITRIPKWNETIIHTERSRIIEKSGCNYLEELVTCVHIIQLKLLTAMRTGQKQKKIDVNIPKLSDFIHKAYVNAARKIYKNVYLFEVNIQPLQIQKNNRELEIIVQECILITIRDSIPVESILRAYMDESVEEDIVEEIKEQIIPDSQSQSEKNNIESNELSDLIDSVKPSDKHENNLNDNIGSGLSQLTQSSDTTSKSLQFNNVDMIRDINNNDTTITAPKDLETLAKIEELKAVERSIEQELENDNFRLKIYDQPTNLSDTDIHVIDPPKIELNNVMLDFEVLE